MSYKRNIPWTRQPQTPTGITAEFRGSLVHALNGALASPTQIYDSAQQKMLSIQAGTTVLEAANVGVGKYGKYVKTDRAASALNGGEIVLGTKLSEYASLDQFTIIAHVRRTAAEENGILGTNFGGANGVGSTQIQWWSENNLYFDIHDEVERVIHADTDVGDLARAYTWDGAANRKIIYKNGVAALEDTADAGALSGIHQYLAMGNGIACYSFLVFNKVLDKGTVKRLSENPWLVFDPLKRNIYVSAAASGVVESDANSSGVATVTGVSGAIAGSDGASAGVAVVTGVSGADAGSIAASTGVATTSGISGEIIASVASSAGTSTAQADTSGTIVDAVASSSGTSTASGISGAIQGSVGASSGSSTAEGVGADGAAVVVVESNSGGYYIRLPDYRRKKRQQEESEPVQTKQQPRQSVKPLFYADDTNQLSPYIPALFDVFAQRQAAQMQYRRMYNIRARAALLAA